jgi:hypothetical protein
MPLEELHERLDVFTRSVGIVALRLEADGGEATKRSSE